MTAVLPSKAWLFVSRTFTIFVFLSVISIFLSVSSFCSFFLFLFFLFSFSSIVGLFSFHLYVLAFVSIRVLLTVSIFVFLSVHLSVPFSCFCFFLSSYDAKTGRTKTIFYLLTGWWKLLLNIKTLNYFILPFNVWFSKYYLTVPFCKYLTQLHKFFNFV